MTPSWLSWLWPWRDLQEQIDQINDGIDLGPALEKVQNLDAAVQALGTLTPTPPAA